MFIRAPLIIRQPFYWYNLAWIVVVVVVVGAFKLAQEVKQLSVSLTACVGDGLERRKLQEIRFLSNFRINSGGGVTTKLGF